MPLVPLERDLPSPDNRDLQYGDILPCAVLSCSSEKTPLSSWALFVILSGITAGHEEPKAYHCNYGLSTAF